MSKKTRYFVATSGAILGVGLTTGLVASYMGFPVSVFSSAAGPDELQYVPADAAVVAYANVREVMNSDFRQRFRQLEPSTQDTNEFEQKTGVNIEQDIDSVVAAMMPQDRPRHQSPHDGVPLLARGRFEQSPCSKPSRSSTARRSSEYQGKRLITHHDSDNTNDTSRRHGRRLPRSRPHRVRQLQHRQERHRRQHAPTATSCPTPR